MDALIRAEKIGRSYAISRSYIDKYYPKFPFRSSDQGDYISVIQAAELLKISRIAVYKKVKAGQIKAEKIGRNFTVTAQQVFTVMPKEVIKPEILSKAYCSIPQLAKQWGVSRWVLYKRVKKGEIKAVRVGNMYVISKQYVKKHFAKAPNF